MLDAALAASPDNALQNLRGLLHLDLMQLDRALADFDAVIARDANSVDAHYNRALVYLLRGDYERAWPEYAWRTKAPGYADYANFPFGMPRWKGEPLAGKRILIHAEQGQGDTIQFARFLAPLAAQGASIDLFCHAPLVSLMSRVPGVRSATANLAERPTHDFHSTIMDAGILQLPRADAPHWFGPYVTALPELEARYRTLLQGVGAPRPWIGIAWKGSPRHANDHNRSLAREEAARFVGTLGTLVNLQLGEAPLTAGMCDPLTAASSWDDTAALIAVLDLVVTVDTSIAHVAGAMGKPVHVLLPFSPDWRWRAAGDTTPWYPTMRLLRQARPGDWRSIVERAARER